MHRIFRKAAAKVDKKDNTEKQMAAKVAAVTFF